MVNKERDQFSREHPSRNEEYLELSLFLSNRCLEALQVVANKQGISVGRLLRDLILNYLVVQRQQNAILENNIG